MVVNSETLKELHVMSGCMGMKVQKIYYVLIDTGESENGLF